MRNFILAFLIIGSQIAHAQNKFVLSGQVKPSTAQKVYLYYPLENGYKIDSVEVKDNLFKFEGSVDYPVLATIESKDANSTSLDVVDFYLENSDIQIDLTLPVPVVKNSHTEDLKVEYLQSIVPIREKMFTLQNMYKQRSKAMTVTTQFKDSVDTEMAKIMAMNASTIYRFVKNHPSDYFSLYLLDSVIENTDQAEVASALYKGLSPRITASKLGQSTYDKLLKIKKLELGSVAPDFELTDIGGKRFKLSDYRSKYVLLMFWSSDCSHCIDELPNIEKMYKELGGDHLEIVAVAQNGIQQKEAWEAFVKDRKLAWINAFDDRVDGKKKVAQQYLISKIPTDFILNPQGEIVAKEVYGDDLYNQIKLMLEMNRMPQK